MVSHPKKQTDRKEVAVEGWRVCSLVVGKILGLSGLSRWLCPGLVGRAGDRHCKGESDVVTIP